MMWKRVPASYDQIVEVSTRDLKVSKARGEYPLAFKLGKEANPHVFKSKYE